MFTINHLTSNLGKDPWADDFADDVIADIETNYDTYVPENAEHYGHWCSAVASEVSRQVNSDYKLDEEVKEVHDLGTTYDGGYPGKHTWICYLNGEDVGTVEAATEDEAYREMEKSWNINNEDAQVIPAEDDIENISVLEELEDADTYGARLEFCPECGAEHAYDKDTGICINCGFNI